LPPDPKPAARIVDRAALRRAKLANPTCAACGGGGANGHHVLPKGAGAGAGDDVVENIVGLCGSGTTGCHGAFHGNPSVVTLGHGAYKRWERRDREWVAHGVGRYLLEHRPDTIRYVLTKLGQEAGLAYLERVYLVNPELALAAAGS
jgi:hypothetical protein